MSIELKRGKNSGEWHPHAHAIVLLTRRIDQKALSAEWASRTDGSFIVGITALSQKRTLLKSLCEALKYAVKFADLPGAECVDAWQAAKGKRLCQSWGCMWGMLEDADQDGEEEETADRAPTDHPGIFVRLDQAAQSFKVVSVLAPGGVAGLVFGQGGEQEDQQTKGGE
jgi:hypothetical protein